MSLGYAIPFDITYKPLKIDSLYLVTQISTGGVASHSVALTRFGYSYNWGLFPVSQSSPVLIASVRNVSLVGNSRDGVHVMTSNGFLYGNGENSAGEVGTGDLITKYGLINVPFSQPIKSIVRSAKKHSLILTTLGNVYSVGSNSFGQLGIGSFTAQFTNWQLISTLKNISAINSFDFSSAAIKDTGELYMFGSNSQGQLGLNDTTTRNVPTLVSGLSGHFVTQVSCGELYTLVLINTSRVFSFGFSNFGQLGHNNTQTEYYPKMIALLTNITQVVAGTKFSFALDNLGNLYGWGQNEISGYLGMGHLRVVRVPTINPLLSKVVQIENNDDSIFVKVSNGTWFSWGDNLRRQLMLLNDPTVSVTSPIPIIKVTNLEQVVPGLDTTLLVNKCLNNSFAGYLCDIPICFGEPKSSLNSCSGQGFCLSPNKCQCFPPTTGLNCELSEYHWRGDRNGNWITSGNWLISRSGSLVTTSTTPTFKGDSIIIDQMGTYSISLNLPLRSILKKLIIGGRDISATLTISANDVTILEDLIVYPGSRVTFNSVQIKVDGKVDVLGEMTFMDSTLTITSLNVSNAAKTIMSNARMSNNLLASVEVTNFGVLEFQGNVLASNLRITNYNYILVGSGAYLSSLQFSISSMSSGIMDFYGVVNSLDPSSTLLNFGKITMNSTLQDVQCIKIENQGQVSILGNHTATLYGYSSLASSALTILNSNIKSLTSINITDGEFVVSGSITTPNFTYSNPNKVFRLAEPFRLGIVGNFELSTPTIMILNLAGTNLFQSDFLNVTGISKFDGLVLLKRSRDYNPELDQSVPFLTHSTPYSYNPFKNIALLGVPYKSAKFESDGKIGSFRIIYSFGSVANDIYRCHYMSKKKILEINEFKDQKRVVLSLTTPQRNDMWLGFGFDINGTISRSLLTIVKGNEAFELSNHNLTISSKSIITTDVSGTKSLSIFGIGKTYQTITMIVPEESLVDQKWLFYAEFADQNSTNPFILIQNKHLYTENFRYSIIKDDVVNCTNFLQPLRAEVHVEAVFSIVLIFYAILFILCLIFARCRPLVTRGISPHLTLFFLFLQLLMEVRNYDEIPEYQGSLCVYYSYGVFPLQIICFVMILLYFIRYFAIINLNENKKNIYQSIISGRQLGWFTTVKSGFLKAISSPYFTISLLIFSYLLVVGIFTIVLAADSYVCKFTTLVTIRAVSNVELIIVYFLTILTLLSDTIPNFGIIMKCKWVEYIFHRDPYWFRAQIILFLPFMGYSLIVEIFALATSTRYIDIVSNYWAGISLNTLSFAILLVIDVMFPLVVTILTLLIQLRHKAKSKEFDLIVSNPDLMSLFVEFCQIEFSLENIMCFNDIQKYKKNLDRNFAREIYDKYLKGSQAIMEVNLPRKVANVVYDLISNESVPVDGSLFSFVEKDIVGNLMDTYSRFVHWSKYEEYRSIENTQRELIEGK